MYVCACMYVWVCMHLVPPIVDHRTEHAACVRILHVSTTVCWMCVVCMYVGGYKIHRTTYYMSVCVRMFVWMKYFVCSPMCLCM